MHILLIICINLNLNIFYHLIHQESKAMLESGRGTKRKRAECSLAQEAVPGPSSQLGDTNSGENISANAFPLHML